MKYSAQAWFRNCRVGETNAGDGKLPDCGWLAAAAAIEGAEPGGDEPLEFIDDMEQEHGAEQRGTTAAPWIILIVDDERNVHDATLIALGGQRIHGRPLRFLHAYSGAEARRVVVSNPDIALILLDVVMETEDAGLRLVPFIREELSRRDMRIIVRTGQPGYAPEHYVTRNFPIDGYVMKAKLTRAMLIDAMAKALGQDNGPGGQTPTH